MKSPISPLQKVRVKFKRKSGFGVVWSGIILKVEIMKLVNVPVKLPNVV